MVNKWMYGAGLVATVGLLLGGCGDDDDTEDGTDDTSEVTEPADEAETDDDTTAETDDDTTADGDGGSVAIVDFTFSPADLTAAPGDEISVTNRDSAPHTYTSQDGGFDTGSLSADGGEGSVTAPDEAGTYDVICTIHPTITGTLTVEG